MQKQSVAKADANKVWQKLISGEGLRQMGEEGDEVQVEAHSRTFNLHAMVVGVSHDDAPVAVDGNARHCLHKGCGCFRCLDDERSCNLLNLVNFY